MMEVSPAEMAAILNKHPDMIGTPQMYAIADGDVNWWPQCKNGGFVVTPAP
jgi:hypothetical protein